MIRVVFEAESLGGVVTIFLQALHLGGDTCEHRDATLVFFWVRPEKLLRLGGEKEAGQLGSCSLKADLGEFARVVTTEMVDQIVLMILELDRVLLGKAPFAVAARNPPIGNILLVDGDTDFFEG